MRHQSPRFASREQREPLAGICGTHNPPRVQSGFSCVNSNLFLSMLTEDKITDFDPRITQKPRSLDPFMVSLPLLGRHESVSLLSAPVSPPLIPEGDDDDFRGRAQGHAKACHTVSPRKHSQSLIINHSSIDKSSPFRFWISHACNWDRNETRKPLSEIYPRIQARVPLSAVDTALQPSRSRGLRPYETSRCGVASPVQSCACIAPAHLEPPWTTLYTKSSLTYGFSSFSGRLSTGW